MQRGWRETGKKGVATVKGRAKKKGVEPVKEEEEEDVFAEVGEVVTPKGRGEKGSVDEQYVRALENRQHAGDDRGWGGGGGGGGQGSG